MKKWVVIVALLSPVWIRSQSMSMTTNSNVPVSTSLSGMIILSISANCPSGTTEVAALNGKFLHGTVAANGNVGTSGGSATITSTGSVSTPTFTGNSGTTSAVSAGTPAGSNATVAFTPTGTNAWPVNV